ncbi:hypothetical protein D3C72_1110200 [compost metagenome]
MAEQIIITVNESDTTVLHYGTCIARLDIKFTDHAGYVDFGEQFTWCQRNIAVIREILLGCSPVCSFAEHKSNVSRIRCHLNQNTGLAVLNGEIDLIILDAGVPHPKIPVFEVLIWSCIGQLYKPFWINKNRYGLRSAAIRDRNCCCTQTSGFNQAFVCNRSYFRFVGYVSSRTCHRSFASIIVFRHYSGLMCVVNL